MVGKNNIEPVAKVYNEKNKGLVFVLNACLRFCKGNFIKLIAADDILDSRYLSSCIHTMNEKDYKWAFTNAGYIDETGTAIGGLLHPNPNKVPEGNIFSDLLQQNFIPALSVILKKQVFDELGFFDENIWIEDWEYWLRTATKYDVLYIPEVLAYYRTHGENISKRRNFRSIEAELEILKKYCSSRLDCRRYIDPRVRGAYISNPECRQELGTWYQNYDFRNKLLANLIKLQSPPLVIKAQAFLSKVFLKQKG
ncbi:glycosyltransferase family protein [Niabella hibiscisoli]|uniref:hypothetical protein n=1 Tax=Niabella hibiscisoli TaxID=1825928 RepID=UPI001F108E01|nr:hypothetical protein [Niabella hibiscisoli]MCH5719956.1 hypothetical protein [Niabella hibiscisoli]